MVPRKDESGRPKDANLATDVMQRPRPSVLQEGRARSRVLTDGRFDPPDLVGVLAAEGVAEYAINQARLDVDIGLRKANSHLRPSTHASMTELDAASGSRR